MTTQDIQASQEAEIDLEPDDEALPDDSIAAMVFAGLILVLAVVFFFRTAGIRSEAAIWPRLLSGGLIILCTLRLGLAALSRFRHARVANGIDLDRAPWRRRINPAVWRRLFTAGWILAYCVVAEYAGFGPTMLVFIPVYMWVCGFRRPVWIVAITAGSALALSLLFGTVIGVPLWEGGL